MAQYDCDLILDIMPLVKDGAASETTKRILGEHIACCDSCLKIYAELPQSQQQSEEASVRTLQKIRRKMTVSAWAIMIFATLVGGFLTMTEHMGYNVVLFPLVGIAAFLLMGNGAWKGIPVVATASSLLLVLRLVTVWAPASWEELRSVVLFSLCYGGAYGAGVGISWLLRKALLLPQEPGLWGRVKHFCRFLPALVILGSLLWVCDSFLGNPISYAAVKAHAQSYLEEEYPYLDLEPGEIEFDWYSGPAYWIEVTSPTSRDTYFSMKYDRLGRFVGDSYVDQVVSGRNTFSRISQELDLETEKLRYALEEKGYSVSCNINSDWPSIYDGVIEYPFEPEYELKIQSLDTDGDYSASMMFRSYGILDIWKRVEEPTEEALAEALMEIQDAVNSVYGPAPACVDVQLYNEDSSITVKGFPYEHIGGDRMEALITNFVNRWIQFEQEYELALSQQ